MTLTRLLARSLCLLSLLPTLALAQFKWTDANGRVHYGDNPPRDARNIERVGAGGASAPEGDPAAALPFEVRRAMSNFPLTLYTAPDCGPCNGARELLRARGAPYTEVTVTSQKDLQAFRALQLGDKVPVLVVGRQAVREFDPQAWHISLDSAGYPRNAVLPRTWRNPAPRAISPDEPATNTSGTTPAPRN